MVWAWLNGQYIVQCQYNGTTVAELATSTHNLENIFYQQIFLPTDPVTNNYRKKSQEGASLPPSLVRREGDGLSSIHQS